MFDPDDLKGIIPPIATPLTPAEEVDVGGMRRLVSYLLGGRRPRHLRAGGHRRVCLPACLGERIRAIEAVVEAVAGRVPVMAGISVRRHPAGHRALPGGRRPRAVRDFVVCTAPCTTARSGSNGSMSICGPSLRDRRVMPAALTTSRPLPPPSNLKRSRGWRRSRTWSGSRTQATSSMSRMSCSACAGTAFGCSSVRNTISSRAAAGRADGAHPRRPTSSRWINVKMYGGVPGREDRRSAGLAGIVQPLCGCARRHPFLDQHGQGRPAPDGHLRPDRRRARAAAHRRGNRTATVAFEPVSPSVNAQGRDGNVDHQRTTRELS